MDGLTPLFTADIMPLRMFWRVEAHSAPDSAVVAHAAAADLRSGGANWASTSRRARIYVQNGQMPEAEKMIATAINDVPSDKPLHEKILQQIRRRLTTSSAFRG